MDEEKYIDKDIVERRMVSYCIDSLFVGIIVFLIQLRNLSLNNTVEILKITFRDLVLLDIIYHYICYLKFDATIGGFICNIKLVDKNNQKLTDIKKLKRVILKIITKYFIFGILFLSICFEKTDIWYDKKLNIKFILNKDEDEDTKRIMLLLKFNFAVNGLIIGLIIMFIYFIIFSFFGFLDIGTIIFMGIYVIFYGLIFIMVIMVILNIILSPIRKEYVEGSLEKDIIKNIDIDKNIELDILDENKKLEKLKKNILKDRASAFYMDCIFVFFIFLIISVTKLKYNWFVVILLLDIIYNCLCNLIFSTTIGGLVFQIITVNKEGKKLSIIENVLRIIMKELSKFLLFIPFLYTYMLKKEMWYDKILKTRVISKEEYKNM